MMTDGQEPLLTVLIITEDEAVSRSQVDEVNMHMSGVMGHITDL
jgi:hypothetical protein